MKQSFEEYLSDKCPCHTNNSPEGFENWLEQLDVERYILYGMDFATKCYNKGKIDGLNRAREILKEL